MIRLPAYVGRVTGVPMEPRAAVALYDEANDCFTLYAGGGGAARHRSELALLAGVTEDRFRLVCGDVGGNFGTRNRVYPEFPLLLLAAKRLGQPVKWTADRSESMVSDLQGRDLVSDVELALDADGKFLAFRGVNTSNTGGYPVAYAPLSKGAGIATGPYYIPTAAMRLRGLHQHATDQPIPQCRTTRMRLCAGTLDRYRRTNNRH